MRSSKLEKVYRKHQKQTDTAICTFCNIHEGHAQFVKDMKFFTIIRNRFPYSFWDGQGVADHLMIVPHKHIDSLGTLDDNEKIEYVDILQQYEKQGYNVYARAPQSVMKSIVHQHTHLIKPAGAVKRFVLTIRKPLIRIIR
jgi:diadenosine tetraphosphate (Ap4A) HIT family hydrolase